MATVAECAQAGDVLTPMSPLWEAQKNATGLMGISSTTLNIHMGFNEVEGTNSCNKIMTMSPEDHQLINDAHSPNKTPAPEDTATHNNHPNHPPIAAQKR